MAVITNTLAMKLRGTLREANTEIAKSSERISTGKRINHARDDAAGLAVLTRLDTQATEYSQSIRNANDGISLLQTAEAGLTSLSEGILRIRELALAAANGTLTNEERQLIQFEAQHILQQLQQIIESSTFNERDIFRGENTVSINIGNSDEETIEINVSNMAQMFTSSGMSSLDLTTTEGVNKAINTLDQFHERIHLETAQIGAGISRITSSINSFSEMHIAMQAAKARIGDADIAKEVSNLASNILKRDASIFLLTKTQSQEKLIIKLLESTK